MNIKQKNILLLCLIFGAVTFSSLFISSEPAAALTKRQWQACQDKYQGLEVYNDPELRLKWEKFLDNKCYVGNGGNCGTIHIGSGTFSGSRADCPISDKYIKEAEARDLETSVGDDCGGVETAIIKCNADNDGELKDNGVWALLLMAINILTAGIGIAAIGGIVYGSILYTTAGDNESQITNAKEIIRNVIIGIIMYIAMYALLQFIIPGGVFK